MNQIRILKRCPICRAVRVEGSGGWSTDYVCGTRRGNVSEEIHWQGKLCFDRKEKSEDRKAKKAEKTNAI